MTTATAWGEWRLGDLTDVMSSVVELLGHSRQVERIASSVPHDDGVPRVEVLVRDTVGAARLREEVLRSEFIAEFYGADRPEHFTVRVAGVELTVDVVGSQP